MEGLKSKWASVSKFFSAFNGLEMFLLVQIVLLVFVSVKVSPLLFPLGMIIVPSLALAVGLMVLILILILVPDGKKTKILIPTLNWLVENCCQIEVSGVDINEVEDCIIICNYPSCFIDYGMIPAILLNNDKQFFVVAKSISAKWFMDSKNILSIDSGGGQFETLKQEIRERLQKKELPIVYPEKSFSLRRNGSELRPFRSGIFKIAQVLCRKILVVRIDPISHFFGFILNKSLRVKLQWLQEYTPEGAKRQMESLIS